MDTSILELAWALGPFAICGEGNVSVRDDDSFWMKASGASLTNLGKTEMIACKMTGVPFDSLGLKPSIETGFHAWILREFDDINFIVTNITCTIKRKIFII